MDLSALWDAYRGWADWWYSATDSGLAPGVWYGCSTFVFGSALSLFIAGVSRGEYVGARGTALSLAAGFAVGLAPVAVPIVAIVALGSVLYGAGSLTGAVGDGVVQRLDYRKARAAKIGSFGRDPRGDVSLSSGGGEVSIVE